MNKLPCVAVAGASGFVGQAVVQDMRAQGYRVRALARRPLRVPHPDDFVIPNFNNVPALAQAMAPATTLLHLAARAHQTQPLANHDDALFADNLAVTNSLMEAAYSAAIQRVVLVSSIHVHGRRTTGHAFTEADAPAPAEAYARSKLQCEQAVVQACVHTGTAYVVVRPPLVYGPDAPANFGRLVRAAARGWPLPFGAIHNRRSFVGIDNLVDALLLCATHPAAGGQTYLVSDGQDTSTSDLLRLLAQGMDRRLILLPIPESWLRGVGDLAGRGDTIARLCDSLQVNSALIRAQLGWQPPFTLQQGLTRAVGTKNAVQ